MKEYGFGISYKWLRGVGLGFRLFSDGSCSKFYVLLFQFINFELSLFVSVLRDCDGTCKLKEKEDAGQSN